MNKTPVHKPCCSAWNKAWNTRNSEHARKKPNGGFCFIPAMALLRAWRAYKSGIVRLYDLRVWFACFEAVARRCDVAPHRCSQYTTGEIHRLVGGRNPDDVRTAFRRLSNAGLLNWSERQIRFPAEMSKVDADGDPGLQDMIDWVVNHRRKVPVPRRTLRYMAGVSRPVMIASILGHLLRCLYYRAGLCQPEGRCKSSWVAEVFGVDGRNVKAARAELRSLGWLVSMPSPQTAKNRWGAAVRINLFWAVPPLTSSHGSPPPRAVSDSESPPPRKNWELSSRSEDHKPARPDRTGACALPAPNLRHVCLEDLQDVRRLDLLLAQARRRGLFAGSEADRLRLHAAAAHAVRIGKTNPAGLFASIIHRRLWSFITAADEDVARGRLLGFQRHRTPTTGRCIAPPQYQQKPATVSTILQSLLPKLTAQAA